MMTELLDLKQSSSELKVSIFTLRSWLYQRKLPHVKLGRRVLVRREDLEKFVNDNVVGAGGRLNREHRG